ncbi:AsmA family protein [Zavarzinia sp.]|uniref:AsmA family protein n=1 Tax=Zavarzinia sp. TaxID=2027920 RepID=UPI003564F526
MRKLLIGVGLVVGLLIGLAFAAPLLVDLNDRKPQIAALIEEATGHRVVLGGDIRFRLLPAPSISVRAVRVTGADPAAPDLAAVQALDVRLGLLPLLGGKVEIADVRLVKPVLRLAEAAAAAPAPGGSSGSRSNAPTSPTPGPAPGGTAAPATSPAPAGGGSDIAVQRVVIEEGRIEYHPASGPPVTVDSIEATLSAPSLSGPFSASGGATYKGQPVTVDIAVGRLTGVQPVGIEAKLGLVGANAQFGGTLDLSGAEPRVAGKASLSLDDPAALAALTGATLPALQGPIALEGTVGGTASALAIDDLTLMLGEARGTGRLALTLGDRPAASLKLRIARIDADALQAALTPAKPKTPAATAAAPAPAAGEAGFALPSGFDADVDLGIDAVQWSGGVVQKLALVASLEGGKLTVSNVSALLPGATDVGLSGTAVNRDGRLRFDGSIDIASDNPRALTDWLKVTPQGLPADRLTRFGLTGKVSSDGSGFALSGLVLRLDGATAKGSAGWQPGPRPKAMVSLDVDRLDLDAYGIGAAQAPAAKPAGSPLAEIGARDSASPLPDLGFDLALRISVAELGLRGGTLRNVLFDGTLAPEALRLNTVSVGDYQGLKLSAAGKLGFAKGGTEADLGFKVTAPSPAPLLALGGVAAPAGAAGLGALAIDGHLTGRPDAPVIDAGLSIGETRLALAGSLGDLAAPKLDLAGTLSAPELVTFARQAGLEPTAGGTALGPVDLALSVKGAPATPAVTLKGKMGLATLDAAVSVAAEATSVDATLQGPQAAGMLTRLGLTGPVTGILSLDLKASLAGDLLDVSTLKVQVGPSKMEATAKLPLGGGGHFDAKVKATTLDLALFGGGSSAAGGSGSGAGGGGKPAAAGGHWSTKPIDLAGLRTLDGTAQVTVDRLVSGTLELTGVGFRIEAAGGRIALKDVAAAANPGSVTGSASLDASGPSLRLALELVGNGFDLDALTGRKGVEPGLSGTGDLALKLAGQGRSSFEIVSSLAGQGRLAASNGKIVGIDLKTLSDGLKTVNQPGDVIGRLAAALKSGSTPYRKIATDLVVERGVARLANFTSDVDGGTIAGDGSVDLPAWSARLHFAVKLIEPADLPPLGIDVSGPLDNLNAEVKSRDIENYYLSKFIGSKVPGLPLPGGGGGKGVVDQLLKGLGGN